MASGFKNGQCLNNKCPKYKGEIFKIPVGADFVCPECGKKLMEVAVAGNGDRGGRRIGDKRPPYLLLIIGGVLLVAGIVAAILLWTDNNDNNGGNGGNGDSVITGGNRDSVITVTPVTPDKPDTPDTPDVKPDPDYKTSFPYYVSYGIYKGEVANGYAEGLGELIFTKQHLLNKYDTFNKHTAQKGWRIVGTFYHGLFIMGSLYNEKDELVARPAIGKPANAATAYDEKLKNRY